MKKAFPLRLGRQIANMISDRARAGILPQSLQGGLRSVTAIPTNYDHGRRALGIVVGLPKELREAVAGGFPEWDFLFASNRVDPDRVVIDCARLGATAIVGPNIRRRHLMALRDAGINSLSLSPAPLARLRSAQGIARGFALEPQSSWTTARRLSELDVMFAHRGTILPPKLRQDAEKLARFLVVKPPRHRSLLMINPIDGPWRLSEANKADIAQAAKHANVISFPVGHGDYWKDETLDRFDEALTQCWAVVSNHHPLALSATFRGFLPNESRRDIKTGYVVSYAITNAVGQRATQESDHLREAIADRIAIGVLLAGRYVHAGVLVDPLDFMIGPRQDL